ncbi:nucleoside triphosphate pyrophosphohydrolase [Candidatus Parcubacteria bacterium]|nr:nucleoside triphosphate pyrophosphohydrolase [Candidatus Parcubacteria bacterium]
MKYDKLIRDKIPEIIEKKGGTYKIRLADDQEYWSKLKVKLTEEVAEFLESESHEEIADVLEVLQAAAEHKGFEWDVVLTTQRIKAEERGGFKKKIILEESHDA